jgi:ribosome-associated protein
MNVVDPDTQALAVAAARAADDKQGSDIVVIDVGNVLPITSLFVVASASNSRLVRTIADAVTESVRNATGRSPVRTEGMAEAQWILVDYGDVVVHVFAEETRRYYEIERLYRDRPIIEWRPAGQPRT